MGFIPWVRGVAQGLEEFKGAVQGPGQQKALERARKAQVEQRRARQEQEAQGLVSRRANFNETLAEATKALPVQVGTAQEVARIGETSRQNDFQRQEQSKRTTAGLVADQTRTTGEVQGNLIDRDAQRAVTQMGGWADTVAPAMKDFIATQHGQEQWTQNKLIGEGALVDKLVGLQDRTLAAQQQEAAAMRSDPLRWVDAAGRLALAAGTLFM